MSTRPQRNRGQATVELALALPVLCILLMGVVQLSVVVRDEVAVQLAAREAARAASVSADAHAGESAARRAVHLAPLRIEVVDGRGTVTATVTYVDLTDVPLIGALLPDVPIVASVTMAVEPP